MAAIPTLLSISKAQQLFELTERQKARQREKKKAERAIALATLKAERLAGKRRAKVEAIASYLSGMSTDRVLELEEEFQDKGLRPLKRILNTIENEYSNWNKQPASALEPLIQGDDDDLDLFILYIKTKRRSSLNVERLERDFDKAEALKEQILEQEEAKEELALLPKVIPGKIMARVTLGLSPTGRLSKVDVKKAFFKKALETHPDKSSDPDAVKKFQFLQEQYEALLGVLE